MTTMEALSRLNDTSGWVRTDVTLEATPAKLRDGSWGARVKGAAKSGDVLKVTTRAGKSWTATVDRVLWKGRGVTLVSTRRAAAAKPVRDWSRTANAAEASRNAWARRREMAEMAADMGHGNWGSVRRGTHRHDRCSACNARMLDAHDCGNPRCSG